MNDSTSLLRDIGSEVTGLRNALHRSDKLTVQQQNTDIKARSGNKLLEIKYGAKAFERPETPASRVPDQRRA